MANSQEVELILSLNSTSAAAALKRLRETASAKGNESIKDVLSQHADDVGDLAAKAIERALTQSNRQLSNMLVANAGQAANAMTQALEKAYNKNLSDAERLEALTGVRKQKSAMASLDDREVTEALTRGWTDSLRSAKTHRAMAETFSDVFEKAMQGLDMSDLTGLFQKGGGAGVDIIKGMAGKKEAEATMAMAAGDAAAAEGLMASAAALGTIAAGLTAVIGALALFAMWTKAADDAQKKMNASILEGAGASDFVSRSYDKQTGKAVRLTSTLADMRNAAYEIAQEFRFAEAEDATRILSELNQAGITYKEIAGDITNAIGRQEAFEDALRKTITRSRMLGVSTAEVAEYQNTLMTELGYSLETMDDVFGDISNAAERAGVSTKTFFTAVSQATSGMALYSVRISETIGFLEGFSKALGEQDVKKFVEGLSKGPQGAQEAIRDIAVAAGGDQTQLVGAFRDAAGELVKDFGKKYTDRRATIGAAFEAVGIGPDAVEAFFSGSKEDREDLVDMIASLTDENRRALTQRLPAEMGREFEKIAQLSLGTKTDFGSQASAYFAATPALRMEMLDQMASMFGGTDAARSDARVRAAFETTTGRSGEDLTALLKVIDDVTGQMEAIERVRKEKTLAGDVELLKSLGFDVKGTSVRRGGEEIKDRGDIYRTMDELTELTNKGATEQEKQAKQMFDAVNSIFNVLDTEIKQALFESNTILDDMFASDHAAEAEASKARRDAARRQREGVAAASSEAGKAEEEAAEAEKIAAGPHASPEAAAEAQKTASEKRAKANAATSKAHTAAGAPLVASATAGTAGVMSSVEGYAGSNFRTGLMITSLGASELLDYLTSGPQSSNPDPQSLQTMLQPLTELDTPQSKRLQELLTQYEEAYSNDPRVKRGNADRLINEMDYAVGIGGGKLLVSSLAADILKEVNAMNAGVSLGYDNGEFNLTPTAATPIQDAFFSGGKVYRPHDRDSALFFQDGGPMDPRGGGGRGGIVININGGDQALVYRTVARAMSAASGR